MVSPNTHNPIICTHYTVIPKIDFCLKVSGSTWNVLNFEKVMNLKFLKAKIYVIKSISCKKKGAK